MNSNQPPKITCKHCGSDNVTIQALYEKNWNIVKASRTVTYAICQNCGNCSEVGRKKRKPISVLLFLFVIMLFLSLVGYVLNITTTETEAVVAYALNIINL